MMVLTCFCWKSRQEQKHGVHIENNSLISVETFKNGRISQMDRLDPFGLLLAVTCTDPECDHFQSRLATFQLNFVCSRVVSSIDSECFHKWPGHFPLWMQHNSNQSGCFSNFKVTTEKKLKNSSFLWTHSTGCSQLGQTRPYVSNVGLFALHCLQLDTKENLQLQQRQPGSSQKEHSNTTIHAGTSCLWRLVHTRMTSKCGLTAS